MDKKIASNEKLFTIYQIKLSLKDVEPIVWRRFQVPGSYSLNKLHKVIQVLMDWSEYHIYEFKVDDMAYGIPDDECYYNLKDARRYKLNKVLIEGRNILYTYDFGDNWESILEIEKAEMSDLELKHPLCLAGKQAAPPEDTGGPWGYTDLLKLLGTPLSEDENEKELRAWVGEDFDPGYFDLEETNLILKMIR